jgi:hypothetical protein
MDGEDSDMIFKICVLVIADDTFDREQRKHDNIKADIKFDVLSLNQEPTTHIIFFRNKIFAMYCIRP